MSRGQNEMSAEQVSAKVLYEQPEVVYDRPREKLANDLKLSFTNKSVKSNKINKQQGAVDKNIVFIEPDCEISESLDYQKSINTKVLDDVKFNEMCKNLFGNKNLTLEKFKRFCREFITAECSEMYQKKFHELKLLRERENQWKLKYHKLNDELKKFTIILQGYKKDNMKNIVAKPRTRDVGINISNYPKKRNYGTQASINAESVEQCNTSSSSSGKRAKLTSSKKSHIPLTKVSNLNSANQNMSNQVSPIVIQNAKLLPIQNSSILKPGIVSPVIHQDQDSSTSGQLSYMLKSVSAPVRILHHPAPLPGLPNQYSHISWKELLPAPIIIDIYPDPNNHNVLTLKWNMFITESVADIQSYEIYCYFEIPHVTPKPELWKKIGNPIALPLPMICDIANLMPDKTYHFAMRAVDEYSRFGPYSMPKTVLYKKHT